MFALLCISARLIASVFFGLEVRCPGTPKAPREYEQASLKLLKKFKVMFNEIERTW